MIAVVIVKLISLLDTDAAEIILLDYFIDDQPQFEYLSNIIFKMKNITSYFLLKVSVWQTQHIGYGFFRYLPDFKDTFLYYHGPIGLSRMNKEYKKIIGYQDTRPEKNVSQT